MEESCGDEKESKYLEMIRQLNDTVQQLKTALDEKDSLNKSLQKKILELEKGADDDIQLLNYEENEISDFEPVEMNLTNSDTNENQNKNIIKEEVKVEQSVSSDDNSAKAVAKALRNPLILTKILRNVRTMDLLNSCRLVNREWKDLSTEILLKRKDIQLRFYRNKNLQFTLYSNLNSLNLAQLTNLLTCSSARFPCANFMFHGNLKSKSAQKFLSQFGSIIKELDLGESQNMKFVRKLFAKQVPNLERLKLSDVDTTEDFKITKNVAYNLFRKKSPTPKLPSLISIELREGNSSSLIKEIVDAAPNLQQCTGNWSMKEIEFLSSRVDILKGLILDPRPHDVDALEKLTKMNLQLKYFEMNYNNFSVDYDEDEDEAGKVLLTKLDRIISKILSSSRMTLEKIKLLPFAYLESLIEWPELVNVQKLTISGDYEEQLKLPSFKISKKLPNLHTLRITNNVESGGFELDFYINSFLFNDEAPSVQDLRVDGYFVEIFPHYSRTFPNIQKLYLGSIEKFQSIAPAIWELNKLKSLKLTFHRSITSQIDAGFTGMKEDTCQFLRNSGRGQMQVWETEKFRVNPSILELTDLEQLCLPEGFQQEIDENEEQEEEEDTAKPSLVSFKYAFNLMPKLRVFS